jgi:D-sedoheptulose 7-phosphate isomerase
MLIPDFIATYQKRFTDCIENVKVFDQEGIEMSFSDGISRSVELLLAIEKQGKKLMLVGNGGSAGITSHMALDFWKNANVKATAFNDASLLTALANDYSYEEVFSKSIEMFGDAGDALMAISASGNSQNIVNAAISAKNKGVDVVTFSGFSPDNKLKSKGTINFYVDAQSYGLVETAHAYIIHVILDAKLFCVNNVDIFDRNKKM